MTKITRMPKALKKVPDPWEKQLNETDKAWEAFQVYRNLGAERSIENTSKILNKSVQVLYVWKHKYYWVDRARAWDNELDREMRDGMIKERMSSTLSMLKFGRNISGLAWKRLNKMVDDQKEHPNEPIISAEDVLKYAEFGFKLERLAEGEPSTIVGTVDVKGQDVDVERIIQDPKLIALALELDEALGTSEAEPVEPDDAGEPDVAESETPQTPEQ